MGKQILVQRKGRGFNFKSLSHRRIAKARYLTKMNQEKDDVVKFQVIDLMHEPGRGAPLMKIKYETGEVAYLPAIEGLEVGKTCEQGLNASIEIGNILPLKSIPEGSLICNVELQENDGGAVMRASGCYATLVSKDKKGVKISLRSGTHRLFNLNARATIGNIAGGGRVDKPFLKAGKRRAQRRAKGLSYPVVSGNAMNACSHPFGGGAHKSPHKPTTVSRDAPPGRKVGLIAAKRTGRRSRK